ncbi:MAG TPA: hypothetical protein ENI64_07640 [Gammaproteobacteria bacterium]|nr:hypothetical protein [Gammaproteobacteria bacterium]
MQQQILSAVYDETALATAGELVHATETLDAPSHIAIYRDSIRLGLAHALREIYPVCARLLGDAYFTQVCEQYIQEHPSHSPDLNRYGLAFPEFASKLSLANDLPWLPDVLRLERSWHKVFSGNDTTKFDLECLAELTEEQSLYACIVLQENMQLIDSVWPIDNIWHANRDFSKEPETLDLSELPDEKVCLMIWRDGLDMHLDLLTTEMGCLLQSLRDGDSLQTAYELLDQQYPTAEFSDLFGQIAANKWIAAVLLD